MWRGGTVDSLPRLQKQFLKANDPYAEMLTNSLTSRPVGTMEAELVRFRQSGIVVPHLHALQFKFSYGTVPDRSCLILFLIQAMQLLITFAVAFVSSDERADSGNPLAPIPERNPSGPAQASRKSAPTR